MEERIKVLLKVETRGNITVTFEGSRVRWITHTLGISETKLTSGFQSGTWVELSSFIAHMFDGTILIATQDKIGYILPPLNVTHIHFGPTFTYYGEYQKYRSGMYMNRTRHMFFELMRYIGKVDFRLKFMPGYDSVKTTDEWLFIIESDVNGHVLALKQSGEYRYLNSISGIKESTWICCDSPHAGCLLPTGFLGRIIFYNSRQLERPLLNGADPETDTYIETVFGLTTELYRHKILTNPFVGINEGSFHPEVSGGSSFKGDTNTFQVIKRMLNLESVIYLLTDDDVYLVTSPAGDGDGTGAGDGECKVSLFTGSVEAIVGMDQLHEFNLCTKNQPVDKCTFKYITGFINEKLCDTSSYSSDCDDDFDCEKPWVDVISLTLKRTINPLNLIPLESSVG
jgi:hypothetical protein